MDNDSVSSKKEGDTIMIRTKALRKASILFFVLALALTLCAGIRPASAEYPDRTITLVVPHPPGGVTDLGARAFADAMEKQMKKPIVVANKAGGGVV
jgi:tripartite-type tricarboxylate transporter receptor subunit TctC